MKSRRLSRRESILLVIVFALLIMVAAYMFWFRPEFAKMQSLEGQVTQLTTQVAQGQANLSDQQKNRGSQASAEGSEVSTASRLPSSPNEPDLLSTLAALEAQTHVSITSVQPAGSSNSNDSNADGETGNVTTGGTVTATMPQTTQSTASQTPGLPSVALSLQIQGSAAQVEQFLVGLQNESRLFTVNNLSLGSNGKTVTGSLQLNAYYAP